MAQYVIAGAQVADAATQSVVSMADAAAHIQDVVRDEAAKTKETMRNDDNEFNIRKNFLDNAVAAIRDATCSQFNIVVCTDQEHDDFQNLTGQILPMNLLNVEIAPGKSVNFQVYVFDTGKYLRHGKWERDHWWWWGASKTWHDPAAMHVHFEVAQKKLDANAVKAQQEAKQKEKDAADRAVKAAKETQDRAKAQEAQTSNANEASKSTDVQADATAVGAGSGTGVVGGTGDTDAKGSALGMAGGAVLGMAGGMFGGSAKETTPGTAPAAPSFMNHMMGVAAGPAMQMLVGK